MNSKDFSENPLVVVFEDTEDNLDQVFLNPTVDVEQDLNVEPFNDKRTMGEAVEECREFLLNVDPDLVVLDADLTQFSRSTVRKSHVREVCRELGYPLCIYHRDEGEYANPESIRDSDDRVIKLFPSEGYQDIRQQCETLATGFTALRAEIGERVKTEGWEASLQQPSTVLSELADVPQPSQPRLDKYSWGESGNINILSGSDSKSELARQTATIVGYWMVNSVLEFPGVLVDETALASYLGVEVSSFKNSSKAKIAFEDARYEGPFAGRGPYWWLSEVDSILTRKTTTDDDGIVGGRTFLQREKGIQLPPVNCLEDHEGGGYYDVLEKKPICDEHSKSADAWIPAGAFLSRVSESESRVLEGW